MMERKRQGKQGKTMMTTKQEILQPQEAHEPTQPDQSRKTKVRQRGLEEQAGDADEFLLLFPSVAIYELGL